MAVQSGTSSRGPWAKQEMVVEYKEGNFPNKLCVSVWGQDKVNELARFNAGDEVKIAFNLSSREFNGKWYTDVKAWKIESLSARQQAASNYGTSSNGGYPPVESSPVPTADDFSSPLGQEDEDLPF